MENVNHNQNSLPAVPNIQDNVITDQDALFLRLLQQAQIERANIQELGFIDPNVVFMIPEEIARRHNLIAITQNDGVLSILMANPFDVIAKDLVSRHTGLPIQVLYAPPKDLEALIERCYTQRANLEESIKDLVDFEVTPDTEKEENDADLLRIQAEDAPAIKFVNLMLLQAIQDRASDIHVEPQDKKLRIRFRVDGILREITPPPYRMQAGIISRIKILGGLDIAERRVPQDGRAKIKIMGRQIDIRISTLPTIYGEKIVMRILDSSSLSLKIDDIGFEPHLMQEFKNLLSQSHGMILVTGPTGSGKTTTLYSALNYLNSIEKNIITVEDPVEYRLAGINQIQAKPQVGLTFAAGLRSILRQDPDIVMVGEIRDAETAEIAIKAALTGHLVLSTLHTNDAVSTVVRLLNMGVDKYLICSALSLVIAQRLARRICLHCKEPYQIPVEIQQRLISLGVNPAEIKFYRGAGCEHCSGTGYWGRLAIYEFFRLNQPIKELVLANATESQLKAKAHELGFETLLENGLKKVREGLTTIDEVLRVV